MNEIVQTVLTFNKSMNEQRAYMKDIALENLRGKFARIKMGAHRGRFGLIQHISCDLESYNIEPVYYIGKTNYLTVIEDNTFRPIEELLDLELFDSVSREEVKEQMKIRRLANALFLMDSTEGYIHEKVIAKLDELKPEWRSNGY